MKKIGAGAFKANCLAIMDEVKAKRVTIVITKRCKPVAKLVPLARFRPLVWPRVELLAVSCDPDNQSLSGMNISLLTRD